MKTTEKLIELVKNSDLPQVHKSVTIGFLARATDLINERREDIKLIEDITKENVEDVVFSHGDVKIYTIRSKHEWDIKYPYRVIFLTKEFAWSRIHQAKSNFETAFLVYLEHKYTGLNSQFSHFAIRMLGMPTEK
jgi:hypothetical protein